MKRFTLLVLIVGLIAFAQAQKTTMSPANPDAMPMEQGGMSGGMGMMGNMMGQNQGQGMMSQGQNMMPMMQMMQQCANMMQMMQGGMMGDQMGAEQPSTNQ